MLAFNQSVPSLQLIPLSPLPTSSSLLILLSLVPSPSFLKCRRRGAAGRLRRRFGSGGAATTPGTALGPEGCHPRGRPGLSRAPARTPQSPKSHREVWVGKAQNKGRALKGGPLPRRLKLMGMRRQRKGPPLWSGPPVVRCYLVGWRTPFRIRPCTGVEGVPG